MARRKKQTLSAKVSLNWNIKDIRQALPPQLRPRGRQTLKPALVPALLDLSKISKGRVEEVREHLLGTVLRRRKSSWENSEQVEVTVDDVETVLRLLDNNIFESQESSTFDTATQEDDEYANELSAEEDDRELPESPWTTPASVTRPKKRVRFLSGARTAWEEQRVHELQSPESGQSRARHLYNTPDRANRVIPETPPRSPTRNLARKRRPGLRSKGAQLSLDQLELSSSTNVSRRNRLAAFFRAPNLKAVLRIPANLDYKQTMSRVKELRTEAREHERLAGEYKSYAAKAAQHKRVALSLEVEIRELEDHFFQSDGEDEEESEGGLETELSSPKTL